MINTVRYLSPTDIAEANLLGNSISICRKALDDARHQMNDAMLASVDQNSPRWDNICNHFEAKLNAHDKAVADERRWWRSRGFND